MRDPGTKTLIASAVAAALSSGAAFALPPPTTAVPTYYAGGGSAQANAFAVAICQLGFTNVDMYTDTSGSLSSSYYVLYGTDAKNVTGNGASAGVMYMYRFTGGSYPNGIAPFKTSNPTTLQFPVVGVKGSGNTIFGTANPITSATLNSFCSTGVPSYTYTSLANLDNGDVPDFGLTDVEVPMFQGFNNPTGNAGKNATNTNGGAAPAVGTSDGIYDNLFGIAVTDNVYTGANAKTSFSRAEVAGILTGTISDWSQILDDAGALMPAGGIVFLDRGEGSGTKAAGNEYFLGYPGDNPGALLPYSAQTSGGYTGAGNNCTTVAVCGTGNGAADIAEGSTNAIIADLLNVFSAGGRAIAVLGLENPPAKNQVKVNGTSVNAYDFASINGVSVDPGINGAGPVSYSNAITGNYDFFYQNSFNTSATPPARANSFKTIMTANAFIGCTNGSAFPAALPGTLLDADKVSYAKGVTLDSRQKKSTGPLTPVYIGQTVTACSEPI